MRLDSQSRQIVGENQKRFLLIMHVMGLRLDAGIPEISPEWNGHMLEYIEREIPSYRYFHPGCGWRY